MKTTEQKTLFPVDAVETPPELNKGITSERLKRLDVQPDLRERLLPLCRLEYGQIWEDPVRGHRVGVLDAARSADVRQIMGDRKTPLIINDPPYNVAVGNANSKTLSKTRLDSYVDFSRKWVRNAIDILEKDAHFYVWIGADYKDAFQPLPDFIMAMREYSELRARNLITMRNQRGYGTQNNWMWVRQELLYYTKGNPRFTVVYTDIPKILRGYYKEVNGRITENLERGKSQTIRPGNVWVDIQQVFYRMEENVPGCYAQKPLNAIERVIQASSDNGDLVVDFFAHSGTTLLAGERLNRRVYTFDIDPVFAELTIRRLQRYRNKGKTGWQWQHPFPEMESEARM